LKFQNPGQISKFQTNPKSRIRNHKTTVNSTDIFSPAKINLFLAITGRRADGFHDLVSVAAPVSFGDGLRVEKRVKDDRFLLKCSDATVPLDDTNLVLRAAKAFREASGWPRGATFLLDKKIPMGAGLGGGSSNAVAALLGLNKLAERPLDAAAGQVEDVAAKLGSDCPLFVYKAPVVMRGRGERISPIWEHAASRLSRRRILIFKPDISINTAWAYCQLAARAPASYLPVEQAEARLEAWIESNAPAEDLLFNNMEPPAFEKFTALPVLLERLRGRFGVAAGMSGSGSACFALLRENHDAGEIAGFVRAAWGRDAFVAEAKIL
jgi:4-diphosphocytidyl-2-C-methyl-D-erythritol kinase